MGTVTYNVKPVIEKFVPGIIELLGEQNISWTLINKTLQNHTEDVRKEYYLSNIEDTLVSGRQVSIDFLFKSKKGEEKRIGGFILFSFIY